MDKANNEQRITNNKDRVLIVRLDRIGDIVLSTPVIKAIRDARPGVHIAFMVRPYAREILEGNPWLNEVIIYDKDGAHKSIFGTLKFALELRRKRFDVAIALHPTSRTNLILWLAGIPERIGYDRKLGILLTKRIPHTKQFGLKHETDYTLDVLRYMGIEAKDKTLYMPVNAICDGRVTKILRDNGIKDSDRIVVINPSASCPSKRWSAERFAKVSDELVERYGVNIAVISGHFDRIFADRVVSFMKRPSMNLAGKTSVGDVASLLRRSRLFISCDSGPVHIASAVSTPVIAIFGRSDRGLSPERWGPRGLGDVILHKDVGCEECLAHNCKLGFKCLEAVTVSDVLEAAGRILT